MALPMASPLHHRPQDLVFFHIKKQYFLSQKLGKDEVRPEASCLALLSGLRHLLELVCPRWHCLHPASMKRAGGHLPKGVGLNTDSLKIQQKASLGRF